MLRALLSLTALALAAGDAHLATEPITAQTYKSSCLGSAAFMDPKYIKSSGSENATFYAFFIILVPVGLLGIALYSFILNAKATTKALKSGDEEAEYMSHFLGNKSFGNFALLMTTFSTVYSGYTVVGVPNEASVLGFFAYRWLGLGSVVVTTFMIFYPRLRRISMIRNHLCPTDIITDRFNNKGLSLVCTLMMVISNIIYIIANFRALRSTVDLLFPFDGPGTNGLVIGLACIMWLCEISGGFRCVAFTDTLQSTIMIFCMLLLPIMVADKFGGYEDVVPWNCKNGKYPGGNERLNMFGKSAVDGTVGCFADQASGTTQGYLTLHPTVTGETRFFQLYWEGIYWGRSSQTASAEARIISQDGTVGEFTKFGGYSKVSYGKEANQTAECTNMNYCEPEALADLTANPKYDANAEVQFKYTAPGAAYTLSTCVYPDFGGPPRANFNGGTAGYAAGEDCSDGIQNGNEDGVDCRYQVDKDGAVTNGALYNPAKIDGATSKGNFCARTCVSEDVPCRDGKRHAGSCAGGGVAGTSDPDNAYPNGMSEGTGQQPTMFPTMAPTKNAAACEVGKQAFKAFTPVTPAPPTPTAPPTMVTHATETERLQKSCFWKEFKEGDWEYVPTVYQPRYAYSYVHHMTYISAGTNKGKWLDQTTHHVYYVKRYNDGAKTYLPAPFWHYDGIGLYNASVINMLSFLLLFLPFLFNPHWIQRTMAAKTDHTAKVVNGFMICSGILATVPGLYMGIVHHSQLKDCFRTFDHTKPNNNNGCEYPWKAGSSVFGTWCKFFILEGGFSEFVGALAGCSAICAIMSTADSAVIGVGSLLTRDVVQPFIAPNISTKSLMGLSKIISFFVIFISCLVPLADEVIRTDGVIYGFLIGLQCTFLWHCLPAYAWSCYGSTRNSTPLFLGQITGIIAMIGLMAGGGVLTKDCGRMKSCFGTGFNSPKDMDKYASTSGPNDGGGYYMHYGIWAGAVNLFTVFFLYAINCPDFLGKGMAFPKAKMDLFGKDPLDGKMVAKIMSKTVEPVHPCKNPFGFAMAACGLFSMFLALPWYGEDQDGCHLGSYTAWKNCAKAGMPIGDINADTCAGLRWYDLYNVERTCNPKGYTGGMPTWAFGIHIGYGISILFLTIANLTWKVSDDETVEELAADRYAAKGGDKPTSYGDVEKQLDTY